MYEIARLDLYAGPTFGESAFAVSRDMKVSSYEVAVPTDSQPKEKLKFSAHAAFTRRDNKDMIWPLLCIVL